MQCAASTDAAPHSILQSSSDCRYVIHGCSVSVEFYYRCSLDSKEAEGIIGEPK